MRVSGDLPQKYGPLKPRTPVRGFTRFGGRHRAGLRGCSVHLRDSSARGVGLRSGRLPVGPWWLCKGKPDGATRPR